MTCRTRLLCVCSVTPRSTDAFTAATSATSVSNVQYAAAVMVLSHWPHIAEQVPQQVAELVAELVSESFHTSRMCGNKSACPGSLVYI